MRYTLPVALSAALVMSGLTVAAQNPTATKPAGTTQSDTGKQTATAQSAKAPMTADHHFVVDTAGHGMAEVELGKLAGEKALNSKVKAFGQQMVTDHGRAGEELKSLAAAKNITLPTTVPATHQATKDRLSKLSGAAFDKAYVAEMVKGHQSASAAFHKEESTGKDNEIKAWAAKTVTTVDEHLKMARDLQKELSSPTPTP